LLWLNADAGMSTLTEAIRRERIRPLATWTRTYVLGNLSSGRANNFNQSARFFAATLVILLVILPHCHALAWGSNPRFLETGGSPEVLLFFAISGYLIA